MSTTDIDISGISFDDIDLTDSTHFVGGVPHDWFAFLRAQRAGLVVRGEEDGQRPVLPQRRIGLLGSDLTCRVHHGQPRLRALLVAARGHLPLGPCRRRSRPAAAHHAQHGPAPPHPVPALGQQGLHPTHNRPAARPDPRSDRRHHRPGDRARLGRLRHRHRGRTAAGSDRRAARRSRRGPSPDVRLVQPDDRQRGPRVPDSRRGRTAGLARALRLRLRVVRAASGPTRTRT